MEQLQHGLVSEGLVPGQPDSDGDIFPDLGDSSSDDGEPKTADSADANSNAEELDAKHCLDKNLPFHPVPAGWKKFMDILAEKCCSNLDIPFDQALQEVRTESAEMAVMTERSPAEFQSRTPHDSEAPSGSIMSWPTGTDDNGQRRSYGTEDADGHSSKSKAPLPLSILSGGIMGGISVVTKPDDWVESEITIDSGACETIMPMGLCGGISVLSSKQFVEGVEYEVGNGETIPTLGERRCIMMTPGNQVAKQITFQVADVHKALLSISRIADQGFDCLLGKHGGFLIDSTSGERIPLQRRDNLYVLKAWVKQDPNDVEPFRRLA